MIAKSFAIAIVGFVLVAPASADDAVPGKDQGRYSFNKVAEGFLRLDMQTGEVSLCSRRTVGWACLAVPEDRTVLENEIARLGRDNAALKKDILSHGLPLPAGTTEPPAMRERDRGRFWQDSSDLDRVVAFVNRMWHRLVEAIARAQRQVLKKS